MSGLTRKFGLIDGHHHYYARWSQRVDGRPKLVRTLYLGSLDNIVQAVESAQQLLPPRDSKGIDLSLTRMMELLGTIQEVLVIDPRQPGQHEPRTAVCLSHRDEEQQRLREALALERYEAQ